MSTDKIKSLEQRIGELLIKINTIQVEVIELNNQR